jgi:hypothetical protein
LLRGHADHVLRARCPADGIFEHDASLNFGPGSGQENNSLAEALPAELSAEAPVCDVSIGRKSLDSPSGSKFNCLVKKAPRGFYHLNG